MPRSPKRSGARDEPAIDAPDGRLESPGESDEGRNVRASSTSVGSLQDLPVAGLTRRRIAMAIGALLAAWVIVLFARQVGEASEATARVEQMRAANVRLAADVEALERELDLIRRQAYVEQQAREYRLGDAHEIPFGLAEEAPPLAADAPGSAAARLGSHAETPTPLESWLNLLFGPPRDPSVAAGAARPSAAP